MSAIGLVIAIALPISLVLLGLVFMGRRQAEQHQKHQQARAIRQSADDLLEALEFLIQIDNFKELQLVLLDRVQGLYLTYVQHLPKKEAQTVGDAFDPAPYHEQIEAGKGNRRVLKSDREIRYAKQQFSRILKSMSPMVKRKTISETAMMEYRRYLRLTLLEREVDTYTAQGDVAAHRGDVVTAGSYFKAAKKLLIEFDLQYPEKNERIRSLSKRTAALYNGETETLSNLANELSREAQPTQDEFGIPSDPMSGDKKKY